MAEFVFKELGLVCKVSSISAHQLAQRQMLIQGSISLILALQNVAKARTYSHLTSAIKDDLRAGQV